MHVTQHGEIPIYHNSQSVVNSTFKYTKCFTIIKEFKSYPCLFNRSNIFKLLYNCNLDIVLLNEVYLIQVTLCICYISVIFFQQKKVKRAASFDVISPSPLSLDPI